jgi:hypothetical protein
MIASHFLTLCFVFTANCTDVGPPPLGIPPTNISTYYPMMQTDAEVVGETESAERSASPHRHREYPQEYPIPHIPLAISPLFAEFIIAGVQKNPGNSSMTHADPTPDVRSSHDKPGFSFFVFFNPDSYGSDTSDMETFTKRLAAVFGDEMNGEDANSAGEGAKPGYQMQPSRKFFVCLMFAMGRSFSTSMPPDAFYTMVTPTPCPRAPYCFFSWCSLQIGLVMSNLIWCLYAWLFSSALWSFGHAAKYLLSSQDR